MKNRINCSLTLTDWAKLKIFVLAFASINFGQFFIHSLTSNWNIFCSRICDKIWPVFADAKAGDKSSGPWWLKNSKGLFRWSPIYQTCTMPSNEMFWFKISTIQWRDYWEEFTKTNHHWSLCQHVIIKFWCSSKQNTLIGSCKSRDYFN